VTTRADFAPEEWELLLRAPYSVAYAVVTASPSGLVGVLQELAVVGMVVEETRDRGAATALVNAIVADLARQEDQPEPPPAEAGAARETRAGALETCHRVAELLAARATPEEATEYRHWLLALGRRVATAAREGSLLGFGGTPVSAEEAAALDEIARALGGGTGTT
jgi:hypothetical protein